MWGRIDRDVLAGALFMLFGAGGVAVGLGYPMGTAARMGPGYFPVVLSGALFLVGGYLAAKSWREHVSAAKIAWRPALAVLAAALSFALVERVGLAVSAVLLVLVASLAQPGWRLRREGALALVLACFAVIVFRRLLGMPIPLWPSL